MYCQKNYYTVCTKTHTTGSPWLVCMYIFCSIDLLLQLIFLASVPESVISLIEQLMFDVQNNHVDGASSIFQSAV